LAIEAQQQLARLTGASVTSSRSTRSLASAGTLMHDSRAEQGRRGPGAANQRE
jgi:hypothetical protein